MLGDECVRIKVSGYWARWSGPEADAVVQGRSSCPREQEQAIEEPEGTYVHLRVRRFGASTDTRTDAVRELEHSKFNEAVEELAKRTGVIAGKWLFYYPQVSCSCQEEVGKR